MTMALNTFAVREETLSNKMTHLLRDTVLRWTARLLNFISGGGGDWVRTDKTYLKVTHQRLCGNYTIAKPSNPSVPYFKVSSAVVSLSQL